MQSSAQEVTMLFKLIAAAKDSWACLTKERIPAWRVLKLCYLFPIDFNFLIGPKMGELKFFAMKALPGGQSCHQLIYIA